MKWIIHKIFEIDNFFLNKTTGQICEKKSTATSILIRREYDFVGIYIYSSIMINH